MFGFLISILSGALMSIQGVFNAEVTKQTSVWVSAAFVQATALLICVIAWFVTGRQSSFGTIAQVHPKYVLLGGVLGAFITYTVIVGMNSLGPAKSVMLIVSAQLVVAYLIELFGLFGVEKVSFAWNKLFGVILLLVGIFVFKKS